MDELIKAIVEIDAKIRRARRAIIELDWDGDYEGANALRAEIARYEDHKALNQTHDVPW